MITDATTRPHTIEPHSDSRWKAFARRLASMNERASSAAREVFDPRSKYIPAVVAFAACMALFVGGRWFERITTQSAATVPIGTQLTDLSKSVERIDGKMELVLGVRDDVIAMRERVAAMERRQTETTAFLETNRAYINRLASIMERAGVEVPPPPAWQSQPRQE